MKMNRDRCGLCGRTNTLNLGLDLGTSPLADDFRPTREAAEGLDRYPLELFWCENPDCTLVQLGHIVPDDVLWGGDYGFYTGSSSVAVKHFERYADWLVEYCPRLLRGTVVEIAANDGALLNAIRARRPHSQGTLGRLVGVDPAAGPVAAARDQVLDVRHASFGEFFANELADEIGQADLVVANNVVAHVADLHDFISGVAALLDTLGMAVLEFQYLGDLIRNAMIDHVYHEHRQFFSMTSIDALLARHGLHAVHVEHVETQGGSLRVVAQKIGHADWSVHRLLADERAWVSADPLDALQGRANGIRDELGDYLSMHRRAGKHVAGYGASAKSTTLLNWCQIDSDDIAYFVDTTPTKYGRYTPGTGIPIIDPTADSRRPDVYLLTIWNYALEVMRNERDAGYRGQWLVPIPRPRMMSA